MVEVEGFYDGSGSYKIRFMPDALGAWTYTTSSNIPALDNQTGALEAVAPGAADHGPVRVRYTTHFAYEDGAPYVPIGTLRRATAYPDNPPGPDTRTRVNRIDYILHSRGLTDVQADIPDQRDLSMDTPAVQVGTSDDAGVRPSDHNFVFAVLGLRSADAAQREAQKLLHPDAGGDHNEFLRLQEAGGVLAEYFEQQGKGAGR